MKMMTLEEIASACPDSRWKIARAQLFLYWGEYLSSYDPDNSDLLKAALEYAAHGWRIIPCSPASKKPLTTNGFKDATTDATLIRKFWQQHPTAMIGVACGEKSGVWCLDPDAPTEKNPMDGRESWKALQAKHGAALPTHTHLTPGGGQHLIFKWRSDRAPVTNREGRLKGMHINVRGEGGYFIAVGSVNADGVAYTMADPALYFNFASGTDWLHDMIEGKLIPNEVRYEKDRTDMEPAGQCSISQHVLDGMASGTINRERTSAGTGKGYAKAALDDGCARLALTKIDRNITLNNSALSLGRFVKSGELMEADVVAALMAASETNGLNKDDGRNATLATIKSGMRAAVARIIPAATTEPDQQTPGPDTSTKGQSPANAKGWPFKSAKDFHTAISKVWIIKNVVAPNEVSNWCGAPKSGKSALVGDLAMHVCAGLDWRGYRSKQTGGVIYFALERADLVERRWNAQAAQYGLCPETLPFTVVDWTIDMIHQSCVADFVATIRAVELATGVQVKMIVIDTSAKAIAAGGGDENHARDKNIMRANVRRVMRAIGDLHVALVSHTGKDITKGERGSNAGLGDDDILITLDGKTASVDGRNDGPTGPLTTYAIKGVVLGVDEDGDQVDIGIVEAHGHQAVRGLHARDRDGLTPNQRLALTTLERAIVDDGKAMPVGSDYPRGVARCVDLDKWRKVFQSSSDATDATPKAVSKRFERSRDDLRHKGWVSFWNGVAWIAYD
jgi:hypothetical protein